jgi:hypothetical protein
MSHLIGFCDECREARVFGTDAERLYWLTNHHADEDET